MTLQKFCHRSFFCAIFLFVLCLVGFVLFKPIYEATSIIIPYSLHPYDIYNTKPDVWHRFKLYFIVFYIFSAVIYSNFFYSLLFNRLHFKRNFIHKDDLSLVKHSTNTTDLLLMLGKNENNNLIFLPEKSLYQNILVTGTIGSGKTSCCMYPFTRQLMGYHQNDSRSKIGMLILDVKGNYYREVVNFAKAYNRLSDLYVIELGKEVKYNPLDKPNLKPSVLANRLKTILMLFSPNNSESYWLDKVEQVLTESIKLCRLYNNGYVDFLELHRLITLPNYFIDKIDVIKELFHLGKLSKKDCFDALSSIEFFEKEFNSLDSRTSSIIKSEITRITNCFVSDYDVMHTFCPKKEEINFHGFRDLVDNGKIVVLNMNIAEYKNLSKIIATYLKLDFQTEVMSRLSRFPSHNFRSVAFICDEFHEYCSASDADFFSQSREAKCINIVATQSYSSLLNSIPNQYAVKVIIQNLINKLWFRTDDTYTIDDIQKQIGKEDKVKVSKSISENAKETHYSYITNSLNSKDSSLSESINECIQNDYIYDTNFFTQKLETFSCLSFLSDGYKILKPMKLKLIPYFMKF